MRLQIILVNPFTNEQITRLVLYFSVIVYYPNKMKQHLIFFDVRDIYATSKLCFIGCKIIIRWYGHFDYDLWNIKVDKPNYTKLQNLFPQRPHPLLNCFVYYLYIPSRANWVDKSMHVCFAWLLNILNRLNYTKSKNIFHPDNISLKCCYAIILNKEMK